MPIFPLVPLFSREDPEVSSEGGLDPLGLVTISESLAGRLAPGVRERMSRVRFLTVIAASREICRDCDVDATGLEPWLAFELYLVEALVRGSKNLDIDRAHGLPGSQKAAAAVAANLPMAKRRYLKTPSIFGFHGVYKTLATTLGHEREELPTARGSELVEIWAKEQGLGGFTGGSGSGADFRRKLVDAVEDTRQAEETKRHKEWIGWQFFLGHLHPNQPGPREAAFLRDGLFKDERGFRGEVWSFLQSSRGRQVTDKLFSEGKRGVSERDFHQLLAANASSSLRTWLDMIAAFETFSRLLMNAWLRILADLARESSPRDAGWLGRSTDLEKIARQLPAAWKKCNDQWCDDGSLGMWRQRFEVFGQPGSGADLVERLATHHCSVQGAKPPGGKRPWLDDAGGGRFAARQLYSDLEPPAPVTRYVHSYRLRPLYSFVSDLHAR